MNKAMGCLAVMLLTGFFLHGAAVGVSPEALKKLQKGVTAPSDAGPDFLIQGEYLGTLGKAEQHNLGVQVIARGGGKFDVVILPGGLPGKGWNGKDKIKVSAITQDGKAILVGRAWDASFSPGKLTGTWIGMGEVNLSRTERTSPTLSAKPPAGAVILFDGSTAEDWNGGKLVEGNLLNNGITSKKKLKDFTLHLEFRLPYMPYASGQLRANSGCYLQDRYEVQILDSFGLKGLDNECGGIYSQTAPRLNMCLPPLAWQTYDIDFTAARFDQSGKKTADARATIRHNGVVIHDNVALKGETPGGQKETDTPGPIQLQNHGNPVYFRNIWVLERSGSN
jgi:hypothetical protein